MNLHRHKHNDAAMQHRAKERGRGKAHTHTSDAGTGVPPPREPIDINSEAVARLPSVYERRADHERQLAIAMFGIVVEEAKEAAPKTALELLRDEMVSSARRDAEEKEAFEAVSAVLNHPPYREPQRVNEVATFDEPAPIELALRSLDLVGHIDPPPAAAAAADDPWYVHPFVGNMSDLDGSVDGTFRQNELLTRYAERVRRTVEEKEPFDPLADMRNAISSVAVYLFNEDDDDDDDWCDVSIPLR